jgi:hypothetical protein
MFPPSIPNESAVFAALLAAEAQNATEKNMVKERLADYVAA